MLEANSCVLRITVRSSDCARSISVPTVARTVSELRYCVEGALAAAAGPNFEHIEL
jgi:hypothetical protein